MPYVTPKNTLLQISPEQVAVDQGWIVSNGIAYHSGCFPGFIQAPFSILPGQSYGIKYFIRTYTSGFVYPVVAGITGTPRVATGEWGDTFTVPLDATDLTVKFYADQVLGIQYIQFWPLVEGNNAVTIGFNTKENRYPSYYDIYCGFMLKFVNDFFCFKDGRLWKQNVNPIRNNFFGVQYKSRIQFICNIDNKKNKIFYNLRLDSLGRWYCPVMTTPVTDQFPNGMESRITKSNWKLIDGVLWADILNDVNDPNFADITPLSTREATALFNGRKMQGKYLVIDLEVAETTEAKLTSAEVYYVEVERAL